MPPIKPYIIRIKLTPKASRNAVQGWAKDANGSDYLKISLTAIPEKGKANAALIDFLAKNLKCSKSNISIIKGDTDRLKTIHVIELTDIPPAFLPPSA
jgi:uncharacterized protein (TIGR00251 family)